MKLPAPCECTDNSTSLTQLAILQTQVYHCSTFYSTATYMSLASVITCDLVGLEKLTNGFGLLCMVRGITLIAGPPITGESHIPFTGICFNADILDSVKFDLSMASIC